MQPQENPARVLLGLHGNSTEGFLLKNLYWLLRALPLLCIPSGFYQGDPYKVHELISCGHYELFVSWMVCVQPTCVLAWLYNLSPRSGTRPRDVPQMLLQCWATVVVFLDSNDYKQPRLFCAVYHLTERWHASAHSADVCCQNGEIHNNPLSNSSWFQPSYFWFN